MIAAGGASDALTVFIFVAGTLITVLIASIGWIVSYILRDIRAGMNENARHIEGLLATIGPLMWRLISMEDWLEKHHDYTPPRDIGWDERTRRRGQP